jgi:hypothetical protein
VPNSLKTRFSETTKNLRTTALHARPLRQLVTNRQCALPAVSRLETRLALLSPVESLGVGIIRHRTTYCY